MSQRDPERALRALSMAIQRSQRRDTTFMLCVCRENVTMSQLHPDIYLCLRCGRLAVYDPGMRRCHWWRAE